MDRCIRVLGCNSGNGCGTKTEGWKAVRIQKNVQSSLKDEEESITVSPKPKEEESDNDEEEESKERTTTFMQQQMGTLEGILEGNDIRSGKCNSTWDDDQSGSCNDIDDELENLLLAQEQDRKSKQQQHHLNVTPSSKENMCATTTKAAMTAELWHNGTEQQPSPLCFEVDFIAEPEQSEEEVTDSAIDKMISSYKEMEDDPNILAFLTEYEKAGQNKQQKNIIDVLFNRTSSKNVENYEKTPAGIQAVVKFQQIICRCPAQVSDNEGSINISSNVVV